MQIPLEQFEHFIDETILERGFNYFQKGRVGEPDIKHGVVESIVEGTSDYQVRLKIQNNIITQHSCDCQFGLGQVCKHIAAVIFYLQKDVLNLENELAPKKQSAKKTPTVKSTKEKKPAKKKTIAEQIKDIVEKTSHEELKRFVLERIESDKQFKSIFLSYFADQNTSESKEFYAKQIKAIIRSGKSRGYIDNQGVRLISKSIGELLKTAQRHLDKENFRSVMLICFAIFEELPDAMRRAYDTNAALLGTLEAAIDLLTKMSSEGLPEAFSRELFEYCIVISQKNIFENWDINFKFLFLTTHYLDTNDDANKVIALIEKVKDSSFYFGQLQLLKVQILRQFGRNKEADICMELNLKYPDVRRKALAIAMEKKNYIEAISIAQNGIQADKAKYPGLADEWYDWLLRIAIEQNKTDKIIEYSRLLFIERINHNKDYYSIMKDHVPPEKWDFFINELVNELVEKQLRRSFELISKICIAERWWGKLLELVKLNPYLHIIERFQQYLVNDYADELATLYADCIFKEMESTSTSKDYQSICKYLLNMMIIGKKEKADFMILQLRTKYARRISLMAELDKIQLLGSAI